MSLDVNQTWAERPLGMRDVFPHQAKLRRHMETLLLQEFEARGYNMVSSGAFEFVDTLKRGRSAQETEGWWRLFDTTGRTVVLRPDMTPSIARMAAPLLSTGTRVIRWCYAERVYRRTQDPASISWASGKAAESTQVGVEWIGETGNQTDADVLSLCRDGLTRTGLVEWQMVVSHALFASSFLKSLGLGASEVESLLDALANGNHVGFREQLTQTGASIDVLQVLVSLDPFCPSSMATEVESSLKAAGVDGEITLQYWQELVAFADTLKGRHLDAGVSFDLTLVRDITYYTGMVFEVFAPGVGAPVALGGRYDGLLAHFGAAAPAVGFTFEVERLLTALTEGGWLHDTSGEVTIR